MQAALSFARWIDRLNTGVGKAAMWLLFVLMAILMWSTVTKAAGAPSLWTLEMAQFVMVAYYVLGGPYAWQQGAHVRMDLFYAPLSPRRKAWWDGFTVLAVMIYLAVLLWGAIDSTVYSLTYGERAPSAWRPYLWPIKVIMVVGFTLMLLQALASFIRDIAAIRGVDSGVPA
jgi:TRAP-type mannitol/chloroaromatic compound transport system permease small subunit